MSTLNLINILAEWNKINSYLQPVYSFAIILLLF